MNELPSLLHCFFRAFFTFQVCTCVLFAKGELQLDREDIYIDLQEEQDLALLLKKTYFFSVSYNSLPEEIPEEEKYRDLFFSFQYEGKLSHIRDGYELPYTLHDSETDRLLREWRKNVTEENNPGVITKRFSDREMSKEIAFSFQMPPNQYPPKGVYSTSVTVRAYSGIPSLAQGENPFLGEMQFVIYLRVSDRLETLLSVKSIEGGRERLSPREGGGSLVHLSFAQMGEEARKALLHLYVRSNSPYSLRLEPDTKVGFFLQRVGGGEKVAYQVFLEGEKAPSHPLTLSAGRIHEVTLQIPAFSEAMEQYLAGKYVGQFSILIETVQ